MKVFFDGERLPSGEKVWRKEDGKRFLWKCKKCHAEKARYYSHRSGKFTPRSKSKDPRIKAAYQSETWAFNFFKKLGCEVSRCISKGPDLIVRRNGKSYQVEVKKVLPGSTSGSLRVGPVSELRKKDDLIVYALSQNKIIIRRMREHLKSVQKYGAAMVTKYFIEREKR